jgi:Protein of unknown function (DUF3572)
MSTVFVIGSVLGPDYAFTGPFLSSDDIVRTQRIDEVQTDSMNTPLKRMNRDEAENIALTAFAFITSDEERMGRFLAVSGLRPDTIRFAASEPGFFAGILDYVASDEPLLLALAKEMSAKPEHIMAAHWTLSPSEFE